ncbi:alpha/beta hydrolase [Alphaproteobacteria bacterium]|nr:alpha/beta hydrolase [Alphaproteobacteria bacterium]
MKESTQLTKNEIENQYYLRGLRPNYQTKIIPNWINRSKDYSEKVKPKFNLKYGKNERNVLDLYSVDNSKIFLLYIHGGYWQRGDKSVYSFLAEPYNNLNISVAFVNYQMCPQVKFSNIKCQIQQAITFLWKNADELDINKKNFNVMGHSAGAHLTIEMLMTDWNKINSLMPKKFINYSIAVSGIYDLIPLLQCSENKRLKLNHKEAIEESPFYRTLDLNENLLLAYGSKEPPDMQRQSIELYKKFSSLKNSISLLSIENCDHFDTVNSIGNSTSELFKKIIPNIIKTL